MNNKKLYVYILLILTIVFYIFNFDRTISSKLSLLTISIKNIYLSNYTYLFNAISKHMSQADQISLLKNKLFNYEQYKILYLTNKNKENNANTIKMAHIISYANLNNFSKVILSSKSNINKISALITANGYSAGIVVNEGYKNIGYLNHHPKSNYAVYIGNKHVPGITHGINNNEYIMIKFIPLWQNVAIGDEVITSGMDNIFPEGIKVGKIISINKLSAIAEAFVKPYANVYNQTYFYIYSKDNNTITNN